MNKRFLIAGAFRMSESFLFDIEGYNTRDVSPDDRAEAPSPVEKDTGNATAVPPDLSRLKVINPSPAALQEARENRAKWDARWEEKQERERKHPLHDMPESFRKDVMQVLIEMAPYRDEEGSLTGPTKDEARAILTGALKVLDTDYAPEFTPPRDDAAQEPEPTNWTDEAKALFERFKGDVANDKTPRLDDGR